VPRTIVRFRRVTTSLALAVAMTLGLLAGAAQADPVDEDLSFMWDDD